MTSGPHEEGIMVNIGGLASPAVGSVHTDPVPGDRGLASEEWTHVLGWCQVKGEDGWGLLQNGMKSCGHILRS